MNTFFNTQEPTMRNIFQFVAAALAFIVMLHPELALATESSGVAAWDDPLTQLRESFTGPIAYTISVLAIIITGGMLAFGGELNEFARRIIMLVLVIALVMLAIQFLTSLWGVSGAEIKLS